MGKSMKLGIACMVKITNTSYYFIIFTIFVILGTSLNAQPALISPQRALENSNYCNEAVGEKFEKKKSFEVCRGIYYCSDGGCIPEWFAVIADSDREQELYDAISQLPVREFGKCAEIKDLNFMTKEAWSVPERDISLPPRLTPYCGFAISGFENDVVLWLRENPRVAYWAKRFGEGAGSPPTFVSINSETFYNIRGAGIGRLRGVVQDALEEIIGRPCTTDENLTCSVLVGNGRIIVDVLAPSTGMSGRSGVWENSHWEIYPNQIFADMFSITIDLPVTSIRRWPIEARKPTSGFISLDYDEGFEVLRNHLAQRISENVGGKVEEM